MNWVRIPLAPAQGLGNHGPAWDKANLRIAGGHPMLSAVFVDALLREFGDGRQCLFMLGEAGDPHALCILEPHGLSVWRSFLPSQTQLAPTLIGSGADADTLFQALPRSAQVIEFLCHDHRHCNLQTGGTLPRRAMHHAVTMNVLLSGGMDTYWRGRGSSLRQNLRRYAVRAEKEHLGLQLRILQAASDVASALERYAQLEGQGWKGAEGTALASTPAQHRFYKSVMLHFAQAGQAWIFELWAGNQLVSSRLAILQHETLVMLKTTHDEELRSIAPGRLLLQQALTHLFDALPGVTVEFCSSIDANQAAWSDRQRTIQHITLYKSRVAQISFDLLKQGLTHARWASAVCASGRLPSHVTVSRKVDELPADAQALIEKCGRVDASLGLGWWLNFERTVMASSSGSRFISMRRGGIILAVVAFNVDSSLSRLGGSVGALSNYYTTLWAPALADEVTGIDLVPMFAALREDSGRLPALYFSPMDPDAASTHVLAESLRASGYKVFDYHAHGNWYLPVQGGWDAYLASREGTLRSTIKRMAKRLTIQGARVEIVTQPDSVAGAIRAYNTVYANSWKKPEPVVDFMHGLAHVSAVAGHMRLGLVWLNEKPIAAQLWIVSHGRAAIYKVAYDEQHKDLSPGTVLTAHLMQHVIDIDRVAEVDYLIGEDPYKRKWMTHHRDRIGLVAFDCRTASGLFSALRMRVGQLVRSSRWFKKPAESQPDIAASRTTAPEAVR